MDSRLVDVGDLRVHYLEGGSGPPLLMLHGGTLSAERGVQRGIYEPQLSERFRVIAPDHRGTGERSILHRRSRSTN
jgi:pimeloyl-ACP methyl ester carboxylesterase